MLYTKLGIYGNLWWCGRKPVVRDLCMLLMSPQFAYAFAGLWWFICLNSVLTGLLASLVNVDYTLHLTFQKWDTIFNRIHNRDCFLQS